jgi:hypothetical protein
MSVSEWIPDLARRLAQLDGITTMQQSLSNVEVWLGGLFFPEAYITATRQAVAHRKHWSLETLSLRLDIGHMSNPGAFIVDGELGYIWSNFIPLIAMFTRSDAGGSCLGCRSWKTGAQQWRDSAFECIPDTLGTRRRGC